MTDGHPAAGRPAAAPEHVEGVHVLTPMQEGMLYHTLRHPDSAVYLQQAAITFHGPLDPDLFRRAWQAVVDRHATLRTAFRWARLDKPVQVVHRAAPVPLAVYDWSGLADEQWRAREEELLAQDRKSGFDLSRAPLLRLHLARLGPDRHRFGFGLHHIVQDGWSTGIMLREAGEIYSALERGEEPRLPAVRPFRDYVTWLAGRDPAAAEEFWRGRLRGFAEPVRLLRGGRAGAGAGNVQHARTHSLGAAETAALVRAAAGLRVTLNTVLQAAWGLLLARWSGRGDVVFGAVSSGRPPELEGAGDMVGLFVNTVPTRLRVDPDRAVGDWLREVQADALAARAHEHVPMTRVQEWSEVPPGQELFETVQVLQNLDEDPLTGIWRGFTGLIADEFAYHTRTNYPLTLTGLPGERLGLRISHDPAWLDDAAAGRLLGHLSTLLTGLAEDPGRRIGRVPMVTAGERERLARWSLGDAPSPGRAVHLAVAEHAARAPESVAVSWRGGALTYRELDERAGRLARRLAGRGVGRGAVVGLLLPDRAQEVAAALAVVRAGGAWLALDPAADAAHLAAAVREARPLLVLTGSGPDASPPLPGGTAVVPLDALDGGPDAGPDADPGGPPEPAAGGDWPACVVVTAGTTGAPKAVLLDRGALAALASGAARFGLGPDDAVLPLAPPGSGDALLEVHLALVNGARLALPPVPGPAEAVLADPAAVGAATCLRATPSQLAALPGDARLPGVRTLLVAGERCPAAVLRRWAGERAVFTVYGTAETGGLAAAARVADPHRPPALRPSPGTAAQVLDDSGNPLPAGVPGELHLGGPAVARAYAGRPALTAERFRSDPGQGRGARLLRTGDLARWTGDGGLEVLGRADRRLVLRGRVVDPAETEDVLLAQPGVAQAVVAADGRGDDRRLVAYAVLTREETAEEAEAGDPDGAGQIAEPGRAGDAGQAAADQVGQWREVYEQTYAPRRDGAAEGGTEAAAGEEDPEFDTVGWNSSFTGAPIPRAEMREWLDGTLARLRELRPRRVLEIGCGTGMLLLPLSRACELYWGTDLSPAAVARVRGRLDPSVAERVVLRAQEAADFTGVPEGAFDLVVLNSVVQYFPGADYLRRVLALAARALGPGGRIFVGDVRSLPLLPAMHLGLQLANSPDHRDARELRQAVLHGARGEEELVPHPDFFRRFAAASDRPCTVRLTARRGRARNEMACFRYDALLAFDRAPAPRPPARTAAWGRGTDPAALEAALADRPASLLVRGVPDARAHGLAAAAAALAGGARGAGGAAVRDAGAVRAAVAAEPGVEPEELYRLAGRHGHTVEPLLSAAAGRLDVLFTLDGAVPEEERAALRRYADGLLPPPLPWRACANDPLAHRRERRLLPRLRTALEAALPPHLVPEEIVPCDALPLTAHGRPDAAALPSPGRPARRGADAFTAPRDGTELLIAKVWEDVLGVRPVGATDDFFALGGHSLLAMRVVSRLQRRFDRDLDLAVLFARPTVAALADVLRPGGGRAARSPAVPLRAGGSRPPFFAVHQTGMNSLVYQFLADELGPEQPFWMLEDPDIARFPRLEDLAAHYAAAVRATAPRGPYRLGGLSFGGLVAFEAAQQLRDAGEEVAALALFETSLAGRPPRMGPRELLAYRTHHYARVFELIFHRPVRLSEEELLPLDEQAQLDLLFSRVREVLAGDIGIDLFRSTVEVVRTAREMMRAYRPRPWDGPLTLYLGTTPMPEGINDPEFYRPDRALGWDAVAPRLEVVDVPGDHLTLLNPPHVRVLAGHLRALLDAPDPPGAAPAAGSAAESAPGGAR